MSYRSTEKTRAKKDAKRTAMMQAAVRVFAERGYHAATVRDIVGAANVAIGTFYFYFPDKETLFVYLYEETGDFILQTVQQSIQGQPNLPRKVQSGLKAYVNVAAYEPAAIQLLLVGGVGAVPSLVKKRLEFREKLIALWKRHLDIAQANNLIASQNTRHAAELMIGGIDEMVLNLLEYPNAEELADGVIESGTEFILRGLGYAIG